MRKRGKQALIEAGFFKEQWRKGANGKVEGEVRLCNAFVMLKATISKH